MAVQKLMYFSTLGRTYYIDSNDYVMNVSELSRMCDFIWAKNDYGHWQFIKSRHPDVNTTDEYFELKDLLDDIPLNSMYYKRGMLNKCKRIVNSEHAQEVINEWIRARKSDDHLRTPWYEE